MPIPDHFPPYDRYLALCEAPPRLAPGEWFREGYLQALRDMGIRYGKPLPRHSEAEVARRVEGAG